MALPVSELVERAPLKENRISQNRVEELEQARVNEPRSMELEKIAEALSLPRGWFSEPDLAKLIPAEAARTPLPMDPSAEALRKDLEDAARQSESSGEQTPGRERGAENG